MGPKVIDCVLDILNLGRMPRSLNVTYICLIPKVKCPQKITKFSLISLCNVIYKIVSKVLANKLKKILPEVISEEQSTFIPRRQITDNVLVAFEIMHRIKQKRKGNEGWMVVKLNMSKAYGRVEWVYLEAIMRKMGFHERWISLAMMCVKTMSFSVLINGEPRGKIIPTRGLRQGDPISLYLFLLCAEGLSTILWDEVKMGKIKGVSACRGAPQISHLFADDCIIFCRAIMDEANRVSQMLKDYEEASGQKLNKEKTSLFFSKNTTREIKDGIKNLFGAQVIQQHEKYLGLPLMGGSEKKKAFCCIKDQVGRKIASWKRMLLSTAGREILIKAVAQATSTYTISHFMLPDSLCKDLNSLV